MANSYRMSNGERILKSDIDQNVREAKQKKIDKMIDEYGYVFCEGDVILGQRARTYLTSRGFDVEELDMLGFGYCDEKGPDFANDYFGYIIIPFKRRGSLFCFIGRDFIGNDPR